MKKILFCVDKLTGGGAERVVTVWASQLAKMGYDVNILVHSRAKNEYPLSDKVKVQPVVETRDEYVKLNKIKKLKRHRRIIKNVNPDIIINFLPSMQILIMFSTFGLKVKKIETVRISPWAVRETNRIEAFIWNWCFRRSYKIILQTSEQGEYFSKKIQKKCVVIPNPIANQYKEEINRENHEKITKFIAAGRLDFQKNYPLMIKAFATVAKNRDDIDLDIFGAGEKSYIDKLQGLIDEFGMKDRIILRGRTPNLIDEYKKAHAYIISSDFEGMPNALAEAMATELVCISSDCRTGPKDLIDDNENGYLFKVGDQEGLSALIEKVAAMDKESAQEIGKKAREKILNFLSEENSLEKLISIVEEA